jgi:hypothetical protein
VSGLKVIEEVSPAYKQQAKLWILMGKNEDTKKFQ